MTRYEQAELDAVEEERDRQRWVKEARLKQAELDEVEDDVD